MVVYLHLGGERLAYREAFLMVEATRQAVEVERRRVPIRTTSRDAAFAWIHEQPPEVVADTVKLMLSGKDPVDFPGDKRSLWTCAAAGLRREVVSGLLSWANNTNDADVRVATCRLVVGQVDAGQMRLLWGIYEPHRNAGLDTDDAIREAVTSRIVTTTDVLEQACKGMDIEALGSMCSHPNVPASIMATVAVEGEYEGCSWLVSNSAITPKNAVAALTRFPDLMGDAIDNPAIPDDVIGPLVGESDRGLLTERIAERCGFGDGNTKAALVLSGGQWWTLGPDSPEVLLALATRGDL